ncbi:hypothetical protein SAMN02745146_1313 [Hymenobacter daecheongensis DSM 21074]|uniref:Cytochrome c domain-containing protein n=1 Tax=Hymenobacter daecheongensis DSM 21074 TaxID=1121955 RepID=A0A1M6CY73_9BACT|nr:hypothetical protein [Hymenobacter daecheongensis]SHI65936.1 hypothetical protein SAMN02745146_1313 [Hymenobacter daecheongensis DSM 21074]
MLSRRFFLLLLLLSAGSCAYDNAEELLERNPPPVCEDVAVTYSGIISPLLDQHCRSCHNRQDRQGNIDLDGHQAAKRYADNGLLVGVTSHALGFEPMPKNAAKLSDCDLSRIRKWVAAGAPDN